MGLASSLQSAQALGAAGAGAWGAGQAVVVVVFWRQEAAWYCIVGFHSPFVKVSKWERA